MSEDAKRTKFIKDLKNKLNQRSHGSLKEEAILLKAFRYFDLDDTGLCDENMFLKTVLKIGITNYSDDEILNFFKYYDINNEGQIDYKDFVCNLYANKSLGFKNIPKQNKPEPVNQDIEPNPELDNQEVDNQDYPEADHQNPPLENYPPEKKIEPNQEIDYDSVQEGRPKNEFLRQENTEKILNLIRKKIANRGISGISTLGRNFRIVDENNSQNISFNEFKQAFDDVNLGLTDRQLMIAFVAFDRDNSGEIDYDEFIRALRGEMNEFRQGIVQKVFDKLDVNGSGEITFDEMKAHYFVKRHPEVLSGEKTEDQALKEFMDTFQDTYNYLCGTESDNKITFEEFLEYYENFSMLIDSDEFFEVFMNNAWELGQKTVYPGKNWEPYDEQVQPKYEPEPKYEDEVKPRTRNEISEEKNISKPIENLENFDKKNETRKNEIREERKPRKEDPNGAMKRIQKQILAKEPPSLVFLERRFKQNDENGQKELDLYDFSKSLNEENIFATDDDIKDVFTALTTPNKPLINYLVFLDEIRGPMSKLRQAIVKEAFKKLDEDKCDATDINDIRTRLNVNGHKDVKKGEKTEEEVYDEFINAFNTHHDNKVGFRNKKVTLDEFLDFYKNYSFFIPDDEDFIYLVQNAWQINPNYSRVLQTRNEEEKAPEVSYLHGELRGKKVKTGAAAAPFGTDIMEKEEPKKKKFYAAEEYYNEEPEGPTPVEAFRSTLAKRGARGIFSIKRAFKIYDVDGTGKIDLQTFVKYCHDYKLPIQGKEINSVFKKFDKKGEGKIDYEEFVNAIKGEMNGRRKNLINFLFDELSGGSDFVDLNELRFAYNPKAHPDVISGKTTEDAVLAEFLDNINYYFKLLSNRDLENNRVTREEFLDFFSCISFGVASDEHFDNIIKGVFNLKDKKQKKSGWKSIV